MILGRDGKRRKASAAGVGNKARIYKIKLDKLLPLAPTNPGAALPKISKQVEMSQISKSVRSKIRGVTESPLQQSRRLFLNRDPPPAA